MHARISLDIRNLLLKQHDYANLDLGGGGGGAVFSPGRIFAQVSIKLGVHFPPVFM